MRFSISCLWIETKIRVKQTGHENTKTHKSSKFCVSNFVQYDTKAFFPKEIILRSQGATKEFVCLVVRKLIFPNPINCQRCLKPTIIKTFIVFYNGNYSLISHFNHKDVCTQNVTIVITTCLQCKVGVVYF